MYIHSKVVFFIILIFFLYLFFQKIRNYNKLYSSLSFFLLITHFLLAYFSCINTLKGSDSLTYFERSLKSLNYLDSFGFSGSFITFLIYPFTNFFDFTYQQIFVLFSFLGFLGVINFLDILFAKNVKNIYILLFFLPGVHYWSSAIGKDSLIFYLLSILVAFYFGLKNNRILYISLFLIFIIRPYIILFIIAGYFISVVLKTERSLVFRIFSVSGLFLLLFLAVLVLNKFGFNIDENYIEDRAELVSNIAENKNSGLYVNTSNYNLFYKMFMYLFFPLLPRGFNLSELLVIFENMILLFLFIRFVIFKKITSFFVKHYLDLLCVVSVFLVVKSMMLYNLGISVRQKYMIFPIIFIVIILYSKNEKTKTY